MALYYQTEYRLGSRGRISRSYTGFQAFIAILFDLVFGLVFELVVGVIGLALRLVFLALQVGVVVLSKSWSHSGRRHDRSSLHSYFAVYGAPSVGRSAPITDRAGRRDSYPASAMKPDWALAARFEPNASGS